MSITTIGIRDFCAVVYCTQARGTAFAVGIGGRIDVVTRTVIDGSDEYYRVEFDDVAEFSWVDDSGRTLVVDPDYRLEFSAIELERTTNGWRVWLNPWYHTVIEFRCARIQLNGAEVVGSGRWLQDELPRHRPSFPPFSGSPSP